MGLPRTVLRAATARDGGDGRDIPLHHVPRTSLEAPQAVVGDQLVAVRRENALTQSRLAELLGVSPRSVRRWERGERPAPHLVELALPEMRRRLSHARRLREYRERRRRREAYQERQAELRAERARIRAGAKGPAWW